jgi:putative transposase
VDTFHSRFRQECLDEHWFLAVADAQEKIEAWRNHYSAERPRSSLGNLAPEDFACASDAAINPAVNEQTLAVLN